MKHALLTERPLAGNTANTIGSELGSAHQNHPPPLRTSLKQTSRDPIVTTPVRSAPKRLVGQGPFSQSRLYHIQPPVQDL